MKPSICDANATTLTLPVHCIDENWLIPVNRIEEVINPDRNHAYITPENKMYILNHNNTALIPVTKTVFWGDIIGNLEDQMDLKEYILSMQSSAIEKIYRNDMELTIVNKTVTIEVPTTTEELTNNSGFITNTVDDLVNYYSNTEVYNKGEILHLINQLDTLKFEVVDILPTENIVTHSIYLVPNGTKENDIFDEYLYINNQWEKIGNTNIDVSNFYTKSEINTLLENTSSAGGADGLEWANTNNENQLRLMQGANTITSTEIFNGPTLSIAGASKTVGTNGIAIGVSTIASGNYSVALGSSATANKTSSTALGFETAANGNYSTALGRTASSSGNYSTALGSSTTAKGGHSAAIGAAATANGDFTIALGNASSAGGSGSIAIGRKSSVGHEDSIALGSNATASNSSMAVGANSNASDLQSIAFGNGAIANSLYSMAVGNQTRASGGLSMALGAGANADGNRSIAIGDGVSASGDLSIALGGYTNNECSTAIGSGAITNGSFSTALGYSASVTTANTIQLGSNTDLSTLSSRVALTVTSDERDKTDIQGLSKALAFINKIEPIQFVMNEREKYHYSEEELSKKELEKRKKYGLHGYDKEVHAKGTRKGERKRVGVKAQQVLEAMQEVFGNTEYANIVNDNLYDAKNVPEDVENKYSVAYESFIPFLIQAVQELSMQVEALQKQVK